MPVIINSRKTMSIYNKKSVMQKKNAMQIMHLPFQWMFFKFEPHFIIMLLRNNTSNKMPSNLVLEEQASNIPGWPLI